MDAAKKIILLLALVVACALPASALTPSAPENRVWEKITGTLETHQEATPQVPQSHQEEAGATAENAPECFLAAEEAEQGGLVIGKLDDLGKSTGWREGDNTLNLPPLPPGPGRWEQNAQALQRAIDQGNPIRDVSPTKGGGFLDRERGLLQFLKGYGFLCVTTSLVKIRYESSKVYLEISFGELDGEVSISFGRMGKNEEFSFTLFLRLVNPALEKRLGERLVERPDQVRDCLAKLAGALLSEGQDIIKGDDRIFERMKEVRWWDFQPDALKENSEQS